MAAGGYGVLTSTDVVRARGMALTVVAILAALYLLSTAALQGTWPVSVGSVAQAPTSLADVPDAAVQGVVSHLGKVPGVDQLVVLPDAAGGYDVSATVNLGYNSLMTPADWIGTVRRDVGYYFEGVYSSGQPIADAQLYFLLDGQAVAGAGLGSAAWHSLSAEALARTGSVARQLQTMSVNTAPGPDDRWFEVDTSYPAP